jgi:putative serine protease PepD
MDDDQDDGSGLRPIPSPDDRLWRHPSELGSGVPPPMRAPATRARVRRSSGHGRSVLLGVLSGLVGAAVMLAVLASTGAFDQHPAPVAIEQVKAPLPTDSAKVQSVAAKVSPALARVDATTASGTISGTAVVFRTDGYLLTTVEVVKGAKRLTVQLSDGTTLPATLLGVDTTSDVAVVHVARKNLRTAVMADEDDVQLGEPAIAVDCIAGRPASPDVSVGVVSALGRRIRASDGTNLADMIQTNVPLSINDAGAALVDSSSSVIGLVTSNGARPVTEEDSTTTTAPADNETFVARYATPIAYARQVADQIIATGRAVHAWLGIETSDLDASEAAAISHGGAHIDQVIAKSPAAKAGLMVGDVVITIDNTHIATSAGLVVALRSDRPHQTVSIAYMRDGSERVTVATLADRATGS